MQGTTAQILSLTAYGNAYLTGIPTGAYYPDNNTFSFSKIVKFVDLEQKEEVWERKEYADNPVKWFERMKQERVKGLKAHYYASGNREVSDRVTVGFIGGGGHWVIECIREVGSDFWEGQWQLMAQEDETERQTWGVTYGRIAKAQPVEADAFPSLQTIKDDLDSVLRNIRDFAKANDQEEFSRHFNAAVRILEGLSDAQEGRGYDIAPKGLLSPLADQILRACQAAWVFGGMPSWNDLIFEDPGVKTRHANLSDKLFYLIQIALMVAVNSSCRL